MEKDYVTAEELLQVLCRHIDKAEFLRDSIVVLDEFTGFTPVQYQLVESLLRLAAQVRVSVTIDPALPESSLFYMSREMKRKLEDLAMRQDIPVEEGISELQFSGETRNVYYMIFDEYGGSENLMHFYHEDNEEFFSALEQRGFAVSRSSKNTESPWH